jgi:C4-dicarboxylate-binding protein DctP
LAEATEYEHQIAQQDNADALAAMKATGNTSFYDLTQEESEAWRKALLPVQKEMASRVGKDLVAAINKEAETASVNN